MITMSVSEHLSHAASGHAADISLRTLRAEAPAPLLSALAAYLVAATEAARRAGRATLRPKLRLEARALQLLARTPHAVHVDEEGPWEARLCCRFEVAAAGDAAALAALAEEVRAVLTAVEVAP